MAWALTRSLDGSAHPETPRRFADAVATAALDAKSSAVRAAVVLVLGNHNDESVYDPPAVRTFLRELGVPLFVWSVSPVPSKVAAAWGGVESVATMPRLEQATKKVRTALEEQRVAWLALDPISALRVEAKDGCGFVPVRQAAQRSGQ